MERRNYVDYILLMLLMEKLNLNDRELAKKANVSLLSIQRRIFGTDKYHFSGDVLIKVAKVIGISPNLLLHKDYFQK